MLQVLNKNASFMFEIKVYIRLLRIQPSCIPFVLVGFIIIIIFIIATLFGPL
jgi:hypothetical protein